MDQVNLILTPSVDEYLLINSEVFKFILKFFSFLKKLNLIQLLIYHSDF